MKPILQEGPPEPPGVNENYFTLPRAALPEANFRFKLLPGILPLRANAWSSTGLPYQFGLAAQSSMSRPPGGMPGCGHQRPVDGGAR